MLKELWGYLRCKSCLFYLGKYELTVGCRCLFVRYLLLFLAFDCSSSASLWQQVVVIGWKSPMRIWNIRIMAHVEHVFSGKLHNLLKCCFLKQKSSENIPENIVQYLQANMNVCIWHSQNCCFEESSLSAYKKCDIFRQHWSVDRTQTDGAETVWGSALITINALLTSWDLIQVVHCINLWVS